MGFKKYQKSEKIKDVTSIIKNANKNVSEMTDEEKQDLYGEMEEQGEDDNA
jgi:hypothetical protein